MAGFFQYIKRRPVAVASLWALILIYAVMLVAPFIAPYAPTLTYENNSFHPANLQLTTHGIKVREYRCIDRATYFYARVTNVECIHPFRLFFKGSEYKILGVIPCSLHLFGCNEYPVYLLGADNLGRDLFSRIVYGSRISLTIGFVATAVSLLLALFLGGVSGYYGSVTDWAIMRSAEFFMLIPSLYFILFLRSLLNVKLSSGASYAIITIILALVGWPGTARTIRGMVASIKTEDFVTDAVLEGVKDNTIIFRHIIPQISSLLIVSVALSVPSFIMSETTLSYLGLGISDPSVSWGSLINRDISTLSNLQNFPWLLWPCVMLLVVTLAFNFLGDALRDYFDPYSTIASFRRFSFGKKNILTSQNQDASAQDNDAILRVRNLSVTFFTGIQYANGVGNKKSLSPHAICAVHAVRNLSFDLRQGEILGIVGESGSGKSVASRAISLLLPQNCVSAGNVYVDGVDLTTLPKEELRKQQSRSIALIFQEPGRAFDPLQTIESAFIETFRVKNPQISDDAAVTKAVALLTEVGIDNAALRIKNYPHQFSGGQLQRISIALALAQECKVLIADEITTALDVTTQAQIVALLFAIQKKTGLSIIFISHNIDLVAKIATRIMVMYGGKAMECGTAQEIMEHPRHPYTQALLASRVKKGDHYTIAPMGSIPGNIYDNTSIESDKDIAKISAKMVSTEDAGCPFFDRCTKHNDDCTLSKVCPAMEV